MRWPLPQLWRIRAAALLGLWTVVVVSGCSHFDLRAKPGEQPLVGDINFEGNKAIDAGELRSKIALTSSGSKFIVKFGNAYPFEAAGLKADRQRIERFYQSRGYYSAKVTDIRTEPDNGRMNITFVIDEGPPTHITRVSVHGLDNLPPKVRERVLRGVRFKEGDIFDEDAYERTKKIIPERLAAEGFLRAEVDGQVEVNTEHATAEVTLDVKPSKQYRVGRIRVEGILGPREDPDVSFDRTRDASLLKQGEVLTPALLTRAREKVAAMGLFSSVDVIPDYDESTGTANILIKVTEAPFQTFETGVGIEADQLRQLARASVRYTNKNVGRGQQKLILGGSLGYAFLPSIFSSNATSGVIGDVSAQYIQPRIFRKSIDANATVDYTKDLLPAFRFQRLGARAGLLFYLDNVRGLSLSTSLNYEFYFDVSSGPGGGNDLQRQNTALVQSGCGPDPTTKVLTTNCVLGYVEGQLNYDLRDNILQPRTGAFFSFNVQYAGLPFSEFRYIRYLPEGRFYVPIPGTSKRLIFAARARFGLLQNLHGTEKRQPPGVAYFFGGGANSVRAAGTQQMGPLTFTVLDNPNRDKPGQQPFVAGVPIPLGGDHLYEGSVELRWYTRFENLGFVLFFDAGRIYTLNPAVPGGQVPQMGIQYGPGFGIRYITPLGPLRVDLAFRRSQLDVIPASVDISPVTAKVPPPTTNTDYKIALDCPSNNPFTCYSENRLNFYISLGEAF